MAYPLSHVDQPSLSKLMRQSPPLPNSWQSELASRRSDWPLGLGHSWTVALMLPWTVAVMNEGGGRGCGGGDGCGGGGGGHVGWQMHWSSSEQLPALLPKLK